MLMLWRGGKFLTGLGSQTTKPPGLHSGAAQGIGFMTLYPQGRLPKFRSCSPGSATFTFTIL